VAGIERRLVPPYHSPVEDLSEEPMSSDVKQSCEVGMPLVVGLPKRQGRLEVRALARRKVGGYLTTRRVIDTGLIPLTAVPASQQDLGVSDAPV
jgi:hypothetical protein